MAATCRYFGISHRNSRARRSLSRLREIRLNADTHSTMPSWVAASSLVEVGIGEQRFELEHSARRALAAAQLAGGRLRTWFRRSPVRLTGRLWRAVTGCLLWAIPK